MTIDELLNLPEPAWEAIAKMNEEELDVYLKDIIDVEPKIIPPGATPCISSEDKEGEEAKLLGEVSAANPIKLNRKAKKKKDEFSEDEVKKILEGL